MPQFLYRIQPVRPAMLVEGPTDLETSIIGEHFAYLSRLVEKGVVFMAGRTLNLDERPVFGVVIFVADSESAARALMNDDPAVKKGVMNAELFPFTVALWSSQGADRIANSA